MTLQARAMRRGALIVFEGCDRSGKSTQCRKLVEALQRNGKPAELIRFPDRTTVIGKAIGSYLEKQMELQDNAIHLMFSANRWELVPRMQKLLNQGTTLVVDRYAYSGVAFTAAKPGFHLHWCKQPDVGLPKPDVVLFLDVNLEELGKRDGFGGERYESILFQREVQERYEQLKEPNWKLIDASQSIEDVHRSALSIAEDVMEGKLCTPMEKLWI